VAAQPKWKLGEVLSLHHRLRDDQRQQQQKQTDRRHVDQHE
jgi:hypothetical protein